VKFLLVGGGAREHAIGIALRSHPDVELFVASKAKNPGLASLAKEYQLLDETKPEAVVKFSQKNNVEWAVIGPEAPLAAGLGDKLRQSGVHVAAPTKAAAEIETSKRYMRELLTKHKVPGNIRSVAYDTPEAAKAALKKDGVQVALKPIGLTGGKGVRVHGDHFTDFAGAAAYVDEVFAHRIGGDGILIEEKLEGEEFTVQCFTDGRTVVPTIAVQDSVRRYHLRVEQRPPRQQSMEEPAVPIRPLHHRRDGEPMRISPHSAAFRGLHSRLRPHSMVVDA